ncbi:hypothetical protein J6590_011582 [Homalodisca vitripennis]|nr:hypothetical protein J6590_011582 [Homalodisca vitripennis]
MRGDTQCSGDGQVPVRIKFVFQDRVSGMYQNYDLGQDIGYPAGPACQTQSVQIYASKNSSSDVYFDIFRNVIS